MQDAQGGIRMSWSSRRALAVAALTGLVVVGAAGAAVSRSAVAPTNSSLPTISGAATVGNTVTANPGTWTGSAPISYKYQWLICGTDGNACHDVSGATSQSYQPSKNDVGNTIRVKVTATDSSGSTDTTSVPSALITATSTAGCPKLAAGQSSVAVNDVAAPARLQIDQFHLVNATSITRSMTSFGVLFHVSDTC